MHRYLNTIDGSYNVTARWFSDTFFFDDWTVEKQAFGVADRVDERNEDVDFPVDGVFGSFFSFVRFRSKLLVFELKKIDSEKFYYLFLL
jgi:hypothetical protein